MSIFSKSIDHINTKDINELLQDNSVENVRLEFKLEAPPKDELVKKLNSFANTYGGWLIVGAQANSSDGRLTSLPGVDSIPGYKQKIVQWCFDNIYPPIEIVISDPIPTPDNPSKFCYIIYTPESYLAPHFINSRKGIYIRTDEYSQRFEPKFADLDEILHLSERRKSIEERRQSIIQRAIGRFESYVDISYGDLGENPNGLGAYVTIIISPQYPYRHIFGSQELLKIIRNEHVQWRQVGFPRMIKGVISQNESVLVLHPGSNFSLLEASVWGLLAYMSEIEIKIGESTESPFGIHLNQFIGHLLVFSEHAKRIFEKAGYMGALSIQINLRNVRGIPWFHFSSGYAEEGPKSLLDSDISIALETNMNRLLEKRDGFVADMLQEIFFSLNWPEVISKNDQLQQQILSGYSFNYWQKPQALSI